MLVYFTLDLFKEGSVSRVTMAVALRIHCSFHVSCSHPNSHAIIVLKLTATLPAPPYPLNHWTIDTCKRIRDSAKRTTNTDGRTEPPSKGKNGLCGVRRPRYCDGEPEDASGDGRMPLWEFSLFFPRHHHHHPLRTHANFFWIRYCSHSRWTLRLF